MANEGTLKGRIMRYLKSVNVYAWSNPAGPFSKGGLPDILGVLPGGRMLAIEAKAPGRYKDPRDGLTPAQVITLAHLEVAGVAVIVTDNYQDFIEKLVAFIATERDRS